MKSSLTSRRSAPGAALVLAAAALCAGCAAGGSSGTPTPTASSSSGPTATPSRIPLATSKPDSSKQATLTALLPSLITCMKAQRMPLSSSSTAAQVRQAFVALPLASQERVFTACEHLMPASVRQVITSDLATEKGNSK